MIEAYPLYWPDGWKREGGKQESKFQTTGAKAYALMEAEVSRMGGSKLIVSSNVPLRSDGKMRMDREPVDPGVAVYFTRKGKPVVFACDRFDVVRDNIQSIAKTIEALRGIERWGASEMMERAFGGFKALGDGEEGWMSVLGLGAGVNADQINARYKTLAQTVHPDKGGDADLFARISKARDAALREVSR